jgi:PAS domain S-box-containing protein
LSRNPWLKFAAILNSLQFNSLLGESMTPLTLGILIVVAAVGLSVGYALSIWTTRRKHKKDKNTFATVDVIPGFWWVNDPDGQFTYISEQAVHYFGLKERLSNNNPRGSNSFTDRYPNPLSHFVHPEDLTSTLSCWANTLNAGKSATHECRLRRHDGIYVKHRLSVAPTNDTTGNMTAWHGTQIGVETGKVAEMAVHLIDREQQMPIDAVPANIWNCDLNGNFTYFSGRLEIFFGVQLDAIPMDQRRVSRVASGLVHPEDAGIVEDLLKHSLATGEPFSGRYRMRRADGIYRWTEQRGELFRDSEGNPIKWCGVTIDIDAFKCEEDALRYREMELRQLVDAIPLMLWTVSSDGLIYFNRRMLEYSGFEPDAGEEMRGVDAQRAMAELLHPDDLPEMAGRHGKDPGLHAPVILRYRVRRADGVYRWFEGRYAGVEGEQDAFVRQYGVLVDVDDEVQSQAALRRAQEQLGDASRAASLAELSGAIAHEINQPLTAILSNAEACYRWLAFDPPNVGRAMSSAEALIGNAKDAAEIVSSIRALFRRTTRSRTLESLNAIINEVARIVVSGDAGANIGIRVELEPDLPMVSIDRVQIQQVLVNLIRNAFDASVVAGKATAPVIVRGRSDDSRIVIEVIDDGIGLPTNERIGQEFFTTKDSGMGMGLMICESIVASHDGSVWHKPNSPRGTVFAFSLPSSHAPKPSVADSAVQN